MVQIAPVHENHDREPPFSTVCALPDTGANKSIISKSVLDTLFVDYCTEQAQRYDITTANNSTLPCIGTVDLCIFYEGRQTYLNALVADALHEDFLVSWEDLQRMGVLHDSFPRLAVTASNTARTTVTVPDTFESLLDEYQDIFQEETITPMHGPPMQIHLLRDGVGYRPLKVKTARKTPMHYQQEADKLIAELLNSGIIVKVQPNETIEWCSPGFFVPKPNGKVRLVVDFRQINQYIDRPVHPFPSCKDIIRNIKPDSRWFLKFDAVHGYFQIPLDEESSKLTTFLIESGRYRFTRAPMGLNPSSDYFCERTDLAFAKVTDLLKIVDDGLLQAPSKPVLLKSFREVLECCRKNNLTLSRSKLDLGQKVTFAGHRITSDGVTPEPRKIEAIVKFPQPTNITELRSFLGLANQLGMFIPDLSHATQDLRTLLKKNVAYTWLPEHQTAFEKIKKLLSSPLLIQPFDVKKNTELLTDASRLFGLGFALMQRNPNTEKHSLVQCGSRSLLPAESRYSTSELECLAVCYAIKECEFYLQGSNFTVFTDHRPLVGVFRKPLHEIENARLLRFHKKVAHFSFSVEYVPGKTHLIADALSRAPIFSPPEKELISVNQSFANKLASDPALQTFYDAANSDHNYKSTVQALLAGKTPSVLPNNHPARTFRNIWDDLSVMDDTLLVLNDSRLVVPQACREQLLKNLHLSHSGLNKTKQLARNLYYWPNMSSSIQQLIEACEECQTLRPSQHVSSHVHPPSLEPMQSVSLDLFECKGKHYLVMVDRYSFCFWVKELNTLGTAAVTKTLELWFNELGFPFTIISDNGPQFRADFKEFCDKFKIIHSTSSPYNPRSNGLAESAVKAAKHLLLKSNTSHDFQQAVLAWRNTPTSGETVSPAEKFFKRRQRSHFLPSLPKVPLNPPTPAPSPLPVSPKLLQVGDPVFLQHPVTKRWTDKGTIVSVNPSGLSYAIRREDDSVVSRGRRLVRLQPPANRPARSLSSSFFSDPANDEEPTQQPDADSAPTPSAPEVNTPRRSRRQRHPPARYSPS